MKLFLCVSHLNSNTGSPFASFTKIGEYFWGMWAHLIFHQLSGPGGLAKEVFKFIASAVHASMLSGSNHTGVICKGYRQPLRSRRGRQLDKGRLWNYPKLECGLLENWALIPVSHRAALPRRDRDIFREEKLFPKRRSLYQCSQQSLLSEQARAERVQKREFIHDILKKCAKADH